MSYTTILMPTHNHLEMLRQTLMVLAINTAPAPIDVAIFDDGSCDGTPEYFEMYRYKEVLAYHPGMSINYFRSAGEERYFNGSFGQAYQRSMPFVGTSDFVVCMDDDVVFVPKGWLEQCQANFDPHPEMGVQVVLDYPYIQMFKERYPGIWDTGWFSLTGGGRGDHGHGFLMVMRRQHLDAIGGPPAEPGHYPQDARIQELMSSKLGKESLVFLSPVVYHLGERKISLYGYAGPAGTVRDGCDF